MSKRQREKARAERKEAKRVRRETLAAQAQDVDGAQEAKLMTEFRLLSERHAAGGVSDTTYASERRRIFIELGIETPEDGMGLTLGESK